MLAGPKGQKNEKHLVFRLAGAAEGTRTPDPIITNDVLYQLSYSGFPDPTMALLVLLLCRELVGFASHSRGDPLITNDVLYQLSYSGPMRGLLPPLRTREKG